MKTAGSVGKTAGSVGKTAGRVGKTAGSVGKTAGTIWVLRHRSFPEWVGPHCAVLVEESFILETHQAENSVRVRHETICLHSYAAMQLYGYTASGYSL